MRLKLYRINSQEDYTCGLLFLEKEDGLEFLCYTLEDEHRDVKVMHETRIQEGEYKITLRTTGGHHAKYSKRFADIHKGMLWLQDVPNFKWILMHCGNTDEDTSGCILLGETQGPNFVGKSTKAYFDVYPRIADAIASGEETSIIIEHVS